MGRIASRSIFQGRVVDLSVDRVRLPNGRETELELITHPGAAAVLPVVTGDDGGMVAILVNQYRYATDGWLLEVPAGKLDHDESPESCARRELEEETGYSARTLVPLGWIWTTPGFTDESIWLYLAPDPEPWEGGASLDFDEVLETVRLPLSEAVAMSASGEITDSKTVVTLLRAAVILGLDSRRGAG